MSEGEENTQQLAKCDENGLEKDIDRRQKPESSAKCKFVLDKRALEEAFNWIRNNIMSILFFIAIMLLIVFAILCVHFFKESRKGPCDELLCYQENKKLKAEIQSFSQKVDNMEDALQKQIHSLEKRVEDKHSEVKKVQDNSYNVQVLLFVISIISALSIWMIIKTPKKTTTDLSDVPEVVNFKGYRLPHLRSLIKYFWDTREYSSTLITGEKDLSEINTKTPEKTTTDLSDVPKVAYFNGYRLHHLMSLARSFLGNQYSSTLITGEKDLSEINAKLVFLFIDANDRNIILEGENETSQLKRRTVEAVQIAGGKAVVIYQFHPDSRELEDECLYSEELISIQLHPVLKKLSQEGCVLSIYKEFSNFQKNHLKKLCQKELAF